MKYFVSTTILEFKYKIISIYLLDYHRDSTPKSSLLAFANQTDCSLLDKQRHRANIDKCDSVDADINELIIKPWCARFCPRCYTYKYDVFLIVLISSIQSFHLVVCYIKKVHPIYQYQNKSQYQRIIKSNHVIQHVINNNVKLTNDHYHLLANRKNVNVKVRIHRSLMRISIHHRKNFQNVIHLNILHVLKIIEYIHQFLILLLLRTIN